VLFVGNSISAAEIKKVLRTLSELNGGTLVWTEQVGELQELFNEAARPRHAKSRGGGKSLIGEVKDPIASKIIYVSRKRAWSVSIGNNQMRIGDIDRRSFTTADAIRNKSQVYRHRTLYDATQIISKISEDRVDYYKYPNEYEDSIDRPNTTPLKLPDKPPEMWPGRARGRPSATSQDALISYLERVYGPYLVGNRDQMRSYFWQHDRKLYEAIRDFEQKRPLPPHLQMPDRNDRYLARLYEAEAAGFAGMTPRQKASAKATLSADRAKRSPNRGQP
jgi:hypothetical protein